MTPFSYSSFLTITSLLKQLFSELSFSKTYFLAYLSNIALREQHLHFIFIIEELIMFLILFSLIFFLQNTTICRCYDCYGICLIGKSRTMTTMNLLKLTSWASFQIVDQSHFLLLQSVRLTLLWQFKLLRNCQMSQLMMKIFLI